MRKQHKMVGIRPEQAEEFDAILTAAGVRLGKGFGSQRGRATVEGLKFAVAHGWRYGMPVAPIMPFVEYATMLQEQNETAKRAAELASQPGGGE